MLQRQSRLNKNHLLLATSLREVFGFFERAVGLQMHTSPVDTTLKSRFLFQGFECGSAFVRVNGIPLLAGTAAITSKTGYL